MADIKVKDYVDIYSQLFEKTCIRNGCRVPKNAVFHRELHDFGHEVVISLTEWLAALPQRAVIEVKEPATWYDFIKEGMRRKSPTLFGNLEVNWKVTRYEATQYFPNVPLPKGLEHEKFCVWWDTRNRVVTSRLGEDPITIFKRMNDEEQNAINRTLQASSI